MSASRKRRTPEQLSAALEHLEYEVAMLNATSKALSNDPPGLMRNALVESFVLHFRNLADFLWPEGAKADHVLASDFGDSISAGLSMAPDSVRAARRRAHKEIAHLSYDRLSVLEEHKVWPHVSLCDEIRSGLKALSGHVAPRYAAKMAEIAAVS